MNNNLQRAYKLEELVEPGKVLVIYGPRRVGKTTLVQDYLKQVNVPFLVDQGDSVTVQNILSSRESERILERVRDYKIYFIDEGQNVSNIGIALKIMVDARPDLIVIATGSSSFDLANKLGEPLVGRRNVLNLFPLSVQELKKNFARNIISDDLENILTYGLYPQVYNTKSNFQKEQILVEIIDGFLFKDIFTLENIKAPDKLVHLVKLLAQYIGQPISSTKLANEINLNQKTVDRYLELLEKTFVIKKILPFSEKLSQSLKFKPKYYFYDIGIRNVLLGNFLPVKERVDTGNLWENFCFMERLKKTTYDRKFTPYYYFYQEYGTSKEIDIVEEYNGHKAFECKWKRDGKKDKDTITLDSWDKEYPNSPVQIIHKDNYLDFLS